jgi:hypothetical protein
MTSADYLELLSLADNLQKLIIRPDTPMNGDVLRDIELQLQHVLIQRFHGRSSSEQGENSYEKAKFSRHAFSPLSENQLKKQRLGFPL